MTLIHFGYIGKSSYFSLSPLPLPSFKTHPFWIYWQHIFIFPSPPSQPLPCFVTLFHFGKFCEIFHFSLTPQPHPTPSQHSVILIHLGHIGKIFHFSRTSSLPTKLRDFDPFWTYWKSFSFFPHPLPSPIKLQKASLIHFGNIGKTFHFSLPPSPTPPYNALWLWFILDIFLIFLFFYKISTPPLRFMIFLFVYFLFVDYKFLTQCICNCSFVYCKDLESRQLLVTF